MPSSIRNDIAAALHAGRISAFTGGMRDLGGKLQLTAPESLRAMDNLLNPDFIVVSSGEQIAGDVHAWADVLVQSDGVVSFKGHVHEAGAVGDNYFLGAALLDVKDQSGNTLLLTQYGHVSGWSIPGWSDDDFQNDGAPNPLIRDQWEVAKNGRIEFRLHVSTNPGFLTISALEGLFLIAGLALAGYGGSKCDWSRYNKIDPNTGKPYG